MSVQIAVVDASLGDTPAERNLTREIDADTTVYKASAGEIPPTPGRRDREYDAVVISGSQTAAYDDHGWIHELTAWARNAQRADVPMLGICWGHQFLAQAFGGRVVDMDEYEIGYRTIEQRGDDPLFADLGDPMTAFQTHSDRVAELPTGAVELARNDYGIQAFRLGASYGLQFHPEYDRQTAEWILESKDLAADTHEAVAATIIEDNVAAAAETATLFDNFLDIVANHARQPGQPW
ncbi:MAG: GMP synthase - glutamine amidotransferase domain protein [uncultured archaeon A07HN63]|nr:MAG: GMP synthase - glutamine amidotransferase domain protein [uncultured archaeon A07HN63]